ncbi:asparagine synthase (glutamine-hydrolyzing) [Massilia sp. CT11-108]|uniref:asparagine synthase (glutamine-hydrolyzing) n=1 Tax=Massilia sp. CT11-108 TaxID=3393900 RepID=UPI0039A5866D
MCGLAGFLGGRGFTADIEPNSLLKRMAAPILSRGPDDSGFWYNGECGIGLAHRRLSILDLSPAGHQPMASASSRYVIAFNGEIYNHLDIRAELEQKGYRAAWRGHSDTETLLAGFDFWGIKETVERAVGMFAFAVWDRELRTLTLARDRIGEKPMYYGWQGTGNKRAFLFGSELKALRQHPAFENQIDRRALSLQLHHSYVPAPYSIYTGISKLMPGCLLSISPRSEEPLINVYWSAATVAKAGVAAPELGQPEQVVDMLEQLLKNSVRQQMLADVPLGAFLSGGIDSSTVVALMQSQSSRPIKTFSIGFHEDGYNEAVHAKAVAAHLGTDHTELYVTAQEAMDVIPRLPTLYDEPFSDSSQIPTFLVSQLARKEVTVALSGDAGDELFCGYTRYQDGAKLWRNISSLPMPLRKLAAGSLTMISEENWNKAALTFGGILPRSVRNVHLGEKLHKGAMVLASESFDTLYRGLVSHWRDPASVVIGGDMPPTVLNGLAPKLDGLDNVQRMMALDLMTYLPDDILVKVDRAAMGVSLETRVPFLDHRVVEFAWRVPQSMKLRDGQSKWLLRQVLYRHVPKALIERPKMGFGVPIGDWLRGPLQDWAESLISEHRLRIEGFFHPESIRRKWDEHRTGRRNWQYYLWDVLMFQAWLEKNH